MDFWGKQELLKTFLSRPAQNHEHIHVNTGTFWTQNIRDMTDDHLLSPEPTAELLSFRYQGNCEEEVMSMSRDSALVL